MENVKENLDELMEMDKGQRGKELLKRAGKSLVKGTAKGIVMGAGLGIGLGLVGKLAILVVDASQN